MSLVRFPHMHPGVSVLMAVCTVGVGCAARPTMKGIGQPSTYEIAQDIRCEMRESIIDTMRDRMKTMNSYYKSSTKQISLNPRDIEEIFSDGNDLIFSLEEKRLVDLIRYSEAAYGFDFNIEEKSNTEAQLDILNNLSRGTIKTGPYLKYSGNSSAQREFRVKDNLANLTQDENFYEFCVKYGMIDKITGKAILRKSDIVYPITGRLGLEEVVSGFVNISLDMNLVGYTKENSTTPTLAETLKFTTTVSGGIKPTLNLEPLNRGIEIAGGYFNFTGERVDIHKLTLAIVTEKPAPEKPAKKPAQKPAQQPRKTSAPSGNAAEQTLDIKRNEDRTIILDQNSTINIIQ